MKLKLWIDKVLKADITLKIVSFAIAVFLFIFVNDEINPISTVQFNVPLRLTNDSILADNGLVVSNKNIPKNVSVIVKGRAKNIQSLSANDVDAHLNLESVNIKEKAQLLDVVVDLEKGKAAQGIFVDKVDIRAVQFEIEKEAKNAFKVDFDVKGNLKKGYKVLKTTVVPESIVLHGGTAFLSQVASVKVSVNVNDAFSDISVSKQCVFFDRSGREIQLNDNAYRVQVNVEIAKELKIDPRISGRPEDGYVEISRTIQPSSVFVKGDEATLTKTDEIKAEGIDISGATENINRKLLLNIPQKLKVVDDIKQINLSIGVEKVVKKSVELSVGKIAVTGNNKDLKYEVNSSDKLIIELSGPQSKLDKLSDDALSASINVSALVEGDNSAKVSFKLPDSVSVQGDYSVNVKVSK